MADDFDPAAYLAQKTGQPLPPQGEPGQTPAFDPASYIKDNPPPPPQTYPVYKGSILPFERNNQGQVSFAPFSAGPIGSFLEAAKLPQDVYTGAQKVAPGDPHFEDRAANFILNFGLRANPMVRSGELPIPGETVHTKYNPRDLSLAKSPSSEQLIKSGQNKMDAFENLPIQYNAPQMFGRVADQTAQQLVDAGIHPQHSPMLYRYIEMLRDNVARSNDPTATLSASPKNFVAIRNSLTKLFEKQGEDRQGIKIALDALDGALQNPVKGDVVAGPSFAATYAPELYARGRADYSAGKRAGGLEEIRDTADLSAAARDRNPAAAYRTKIAAHIADQDAIRGYTDAETKALLDVPLDTTKGRLLRKAGGLMGGGLGPTASIPAAAVTTGLQMMGVPPGAAATMGATTPAIGAALKGMAGQSTAELLNKAIEMQKRRSPLFMDMGRQDLSPVSLQRDAIANSLLRNAGRYIVPTPVKPVLEYDPNRA